MISALPTNTAPRSLPRSATAARAGARTRVLVAAVAATGLLACAGCAGELVQRPPAADPTAAAAAEAPFTPPPVRADDPVLTPAKRPPTPTATKPSDERP